jgi:hypothetical protein
MFSVPLQLEEGTVVHFALYDWFDVDDWGAVDGFEWLNSDPVFSDAQNFCAMKANGVRAVGGASGEYTLQRAMRIASRMRL